MRLAGAFGCVALAAAAGAATGNNIAVDGQGNTWWIGQNLPVAVSANAYQKTEVSTTCASQDLSPFQPPTNVPCAHAFLMKLDPSGNVLCATFLGGSSEDGGVAVTTDAQGNAYVAGFTYSADFPVTKGAVQQQNAGPLMPATVQLGLGPFGPVEILPGGDVFVAKFAPDGTALYVTLLGGSGSDVPTLIGVDTSGSAYVAGTTASTNFPVTSDKMQNGSDSGYFFARLDAQGARLVYSTYAAGTIQAFDVDSQGYAFLTGAFERDSVTGPYVTEVDTGDGQVFYTAFLPDLDSKYAGTGAAIAVNGAGAAMVGVSPAPVASELLTYAPPTYPLGPSFLLMLAAGGATILAETDIGNTQFDRIQFDSAGDTYALGHGTGTLPPAATPSLLAVPCASTGGEFAIETNAAGGVEAATYLRQGVGDVAVINAPGQLTVYWPVSQTMVASAVTDLLTSPTMNFGCLENLASGRISPGVAPGQIFALFGTELGPTQAVAAAPDASGRFPTSLAGVQVTINGTPAPLLLVQAGEIQGVVPFGISGAMATTEIQYQDQSALPLDAPIGYNPGIFTINGQGAILNQDGTVNTPANPAKLGTIVSIYATGTGGLIPALPDGEIAPLPPAYFLTVNPPAVTFAGVYATVTWAGAAPGLIAGGTQVNAQLPASLPAGTNPAAVPVVLIVPPAFSAAVPISVAN
ncbi:MAG TPA: SBBP repeat-containing protein [Bryobacteraceae bacterium]|nr:SBBP repeat-containing protein [Bryobacteraceae bacterium]